MLIALIIAVIALIAMIISYLIEKDWGFIPILFGVTLMISGLVAFCLFMVFSPSIFAPNLTHERFAAQRKALVAQIQEIDDPYSIYTIDIIQKTAKFNNECSKAAIYGDNIWIRYAAYDPCYIGIDPIPLVYGEKP